MTDGETEAQIRKVTCPGALPELGAELDTESGLSLCLISLPGKEAWSHKGHQGALGGWACQGALEPTWKPSPDNKTLQSCSLCLWAGAV